MSLRFFMDALGLTIRDDLASEPEEWDLDLTLATQCHAMIHKLSYMYMPLGIISFYVLFDAPNFH